MGAIWKKDENPAPGASPPHSAPPATTSSPARSETSSRSPAAGAERATIGRSITIRGDVTGDEDLVIQGRIDGTVDLKLHSVTVGPEGKVKADISGKSVIVEGEVIGDLRGQEHVVLRSTSKVEGNIVAPRVVLEEGSAFRGSIDMTDTPARASSSRPDPKPATAVETKPGGPGKGASDKGEATAATA